VSALVYHRPATLQDAGALLRASETGRLLAGGQTLIRPRPDLLADVSDLIDLSGLSGLAAVTGGGGSLSIGAMTTHATIGTSAAVRAAIPALASLAAGIGDPAVRNRGTIGGALADNDPTGDYQAACLCLDAAVETDQRTIPIAQFLAGRSRTALLRDEIIVSVRWAVPRYAVYERFPKRAGWGVLAGVMIADGPAGPRVAVTGAARDGAFRWRAAEHALAARFDRDACAAGLDEAGLLDDLHATRMYRAHLVRVLTQRAIDRVAAARGNQASTP
jgi:aerobic carbon-monoxide dehydrogenase medium subunit